MASTTGSSSSTEPPAGFRLGRRLGEDVWEAVQLDLDRTVALRRLAPGTSVNAGAWPDRPGVVPLYAVAVEPSGTYVATRLLPGARTLAESHGASAARRRRWIDQAAAALDGAVHGRLTDHDILIDANGRAWLTGFGRAPAGADAAADAEALARLRPQPRSRAWTLGAPLAGLAVVAIAASLVIAGRDGEESAPPLTAGATPVGSALAPGGIESIDCEGAPPDGASPSCTIMQAALAGLSPSAAPGLVRGWAVRGVRGSVALQVLVPDGDHFVAYNRSAMVTIDDDGPRVIPASMSFPAGARFALEVGPNTAVGLRRGVPGAGTARFIGPLRSQARPARTAGGDGEELLLRVNVVPRG